MKAREVEGLDPWGAWSESAARILATRLEELNDLAGAALEPGAETAQHDLRIAAKRVRYLLDIAARCIDGADRGGEAERRREAAKRLQGVLGELHDCDVMLPRVAGIASVEALLLARRERLFVSFRELWAAELGPLLRA